MAARRKRNVPELAQRIGERIRALRLSARLSQGELAGKADITESMLSMVERGRRYPHLVTLANLAAALGVATGSLIPDALELRPSTELDPDEALAAMGGGDR